MYNIFQQLDSCFFLTLPHIWCLSNETKQPKKQPANIKHVFSYLNFILKRFQFLKQYNQLKLEEGENLSNMI